MSAAWNGAARVAMLVNNPCIFDSRVIREAEAVAERGFAVRVFCRTDPSRPALEERNGVEYVRRPRPGIVRLLAAAAGFDPGVAPTPGTVRPAAHPDHAPGAPRAAAQPASSRGGRGVVRRVLKFPARVVRRLVLDDTRSGDILVSALFLAVAVWRQFGRHALRPVWRTVVPARRVVGRYVGPYFVFAVFRGAMMRDLLAWKPAIIHAHDLDTLETGGLAAERLGARLVYDSHELELDRVDRQHWWSQRVCGARERRWILEADAVITVSDSIADFLAERYAIARPVVILNTPALGGPPDPRGDVRRHLGLRAQDVLCLYVGKVTRHRNLDLLVAALASAPDLHVAMVGHRGPDVADELAALAGRHGVSGRFHLVEPTAPDALVDFIRSADFGIVPTGALSKSQDFALPNKLLEMTLAGLPVIVASLTERRRFVEDTGTGVVMDTPTEAAIADALNEAATNLARLRPDAARVAAISRRYGWAGQAERLGEIYTRLRGPGA